VWILLAASACVFGQQGVPRFRAEDVRPHGSAEPFPLNPGLLTWIFGSDFVRDLGCAADNIMDPATYKTELCGTRVLVGGIEARLVATTPNQINLVMPDHPWEDEMVDVQVVRDGRASARVPVYFGFNRPHLSLAAPAFAAMPVWIRLTFPWGKGSLRYPFVSLPWEVGPGSFEVRYQGTALPVISRLPFPPLAIGGRVGLPHEVPSQYLHRIPLHLLYSFDRPGVYEVRYTEYRDIAGGKKTVYQQSDWTSIEVSPSTDAQRRAAFLALTASPPDDPVELLSNFLPSLLARHDEAALRVLSRYLDFPDPQVRSYAGYALNYFDPALLQRVVPGRQPLRRVKT
jgi:hypothetical protein